MNEEAKGDTARAGGLNPGDGQRADGPLPLPPRTQLSPNARAWRRFRRNRPALASGLFLAAFVLLVLIWPWFEQPPVARRLPQAMTWSPTTLSGAQFQPPGAGHWFGTDIHGRDLLSRVFSGARVSLLIGVVGATVSLVIGVLWGAIAGYGGGRTDSILLRAVDGLSSLANIVFVIVLMATFENSLKNRLTMHGLDVSARLLLLFV